MCVFFFKQKTAYEMRISDWVQTCALPISPGVSSKSMAWTGKSSAKTGCPRNSSSRPATPWPCKSWRLRVGGKSKKVTVGYKYYSGQHHVCCPGPIDYFIRILAIGSASCRERVCPYV